MNPWNTTQTLSAEGLDQAELQRRAVSAIRESEFFGAWDRVLAKCQGLDVYLAGGSLRNLILGQQPRDFDFFLAGKAVEEALASLAVLGHLDHGPFGSPRWFPVEGAPVYADVIPVEAFFNGLWHCYLASVNTFFAVDRFTRRNGATFVIPESHQKEAPPGEAARQNAAIAVECAEGSMVVFDSTLWHAAGNNTSGSDRLAINQQFTRSWIKQQIDYVRALGEDAVRAQPPRTQQLLGYYTRVVTSLDEYYRPEDERIYRRGQG